MLYTRREKTKKQQSKCIDSMQPVHRVWEILFRNEFGNTSVNSRNLRCSYGITGFKLEGKFNFLLLIVVILSELAQKYQLKGTANLTLFAGTWI